MANYTFTYTKAVKGSKNKPSSNLRANVGATSQAAAKKEFKKKFDNNKSFKVSKVKLEKKR